MTIRTILDEIGDKREVTVCARTVPKQVSWDFTRVVTVKLASFTSLNKRDFTFDYATSVKVHVIARITRSITVVLITFISQRERAVT